MNIDGYTKLIPHVGYPTASFKAPMIYNPWFEAKGINAVVVPMGIPAEAAGATLPRIFALSNFHGALVTMPLKVLVVPMLDETTATVKVAGSCNAVKRTPDGRLVGDMFDGEGFVRGVRRKGCQVEGASAIVSGNGGVGCAIAASLALAGVRKLALYDVSTAAMEGLASRLREHYPQIEVTTGSNDPAGFDIVVNATPLGMNAADPLPFDTDRISPASFVGEVVMKQEVTPLLAAARAKGCRTQIGLDMLFEMIPAYIEFFGFGATTPEELKAHARVHY
jgi:shikimate dehydrogenase